MFLSWARAARYQREKKSEKRNVDISDDVNTPEANKELNERPELATSKLLMIAGLFYASTVAFFAFPSWCLYVYTAYIMVYFCNKLTSWRYQSWWKRRMLCAKAKQKTLPCTFSIRGNEIQINELFLHVEFHLFEPSWKIVIWRGSRRFYTNVLMSTLHTRFIKYIKVLYI